MEGLEITIAKRHSTQHLTLRQGGYDIFSLVVKPSLVTSKDSRWFMFQRLAIRRRFLCYRLSYLFIRFVVKWSHPTSRIWGEDNTWDHGHI